MPVLGPAPGIGLPTYKFEVAFYGMQGGVPVPASPNDPTITPVWTDLSARLIGDKNGTKRGKSYELDEAQSNQMEFTLKNIDGAFDPNNTLSPFYPYVLPNRQFRWSVLISGTYYVLTTGFINSWPQTWRKHGYLGEVTVTGYDALGALSQMLLPSCLSAEILLDNPLGYWPLTEPSGAVQGANDASTSALPLVQFQVGSGGTLTFGGTTLAGLLGAGGSNGLTGPVQGNTTGVTMTPASAGNGLGLTATFPATIIGSVDFWVYGLGSTAFNQTLAALGQSGGLPSSGPLQISVNASGYVVFTLTGIAGTATVTSSIKVTDGALHHIAVSVGFAVIEVFVDSVGVTAAGLGPPPPPYPTETAVWVNPNAAWSGTIAQVAVYNRALNSTRVASHYNAGVNAFPETSGARFTRILSYGPWNLGSVVPTGDTTLMGLYDCQGKSCLQALLDVCTAEGGNLYVDHQGRIVFENRHNRMTQVNPVWVLGENAAAGEIPYEEDVEIDFDDVNIFNTLEMLRPGGASYNFSDAASMLAHFARSFPTNPMTIPIDTDQNLFYMGQFLVNRYKQALQRVASVSFKPSSNPSLWLFCATVEVGQRVTLNRRPRDASSTISIPLFVESVEQKWDANTGEHTTSLELSPGPWQNYQVLTAARGTLASTIAAGVSTLTINVTATTGNTLAQDGWVYDPSGYGINKVQIVDGANTENINVTSITTGVGSVTIGLATPTAHAHTSGVTVSEYPGVGNTYNEFDPAAVLSGAFAISY